MKPLPRLTLACLALSSSLMAEIVLDVPDLDERAIDQAMVERLKEKYRTEAGSELVNTLRRRCYIPIELP